MPRGQGILAAALLALVTAGVYWPALGNEFVAYDDDLYITQEPALRGGLGAESVRWALTSHAGGNWFPLTRLSWLADASLYGMEARGFHATSVLLHALASGVLALALMRLTGAPGASLFVAGVYALHPLRVESVAWAASRKDVLAGLCAALSLLGYEGAARRGGFLRHANVALWLFLGLLAKPVLVPWPFVLLLLDAWPLGRLGRAALREKLPLLALSAGAAAATWLAQRAGAAVRSLDELSLPARAANALASLADYLAQSFWPAAMAVFYPHPGDALPLAKAALGAALLAGVTALAVATRRRRPWLLVGWLWFLVCLAPVSGLVQVGQAARADRYMLLPHIGLALAVAFEARAWARARGARLALAAAGIAALCACAWLTVAQLRVWRDSESLFVHALRVTDGNHVAHINLGMELYREERVEEASAHLAAALRLVPGSPIAAGWLGQVRAAQGRDREAIQLLRAALRALPARNDFRLALAAALVRSGDVDGARAALDAALQAAPGDAQIQELRAALDAAPSR
jgi:tetratricopeptide (TPR) repeat protein